MALELGGFDKLRKVVKQPALQRVADRILEKGHKLEIDEQSRKNLATARDELARDPKRHFIGYFNHNAYSDPGIYARVFWEEIDPQRTRKVIVPASDWHMHPGNNFVFGNFVRLAATMQDFDVIPIVQGYMIGNEKYINFRTGLPYTQADADGINRASLLHLTRERKSRPTAVFLAPEETRGEIDVLQEAKPGIETMAKSLSPCVVLPMGIEFIGDHGRGLNLGSRVGVHVPEPFIIEGRDNVPTIDDFMLRLAGALPTNLQGVYADRVAQVNV